MMEKATVAFKSKGELSIGNPYWIWFVKYKSMYGHLNKNLLIRKCTGKSLFRQGRNYVKAPEKKLSR